MLEEIKDNREQYKVFRKNQNNTEFDDPEETKKQTRQTRPKS